jgi:uncharacterized iron-regulated membrane protein
MAFGRTRLLLFLLFLLLATISIVTRMMLETTSEAVNNAGAGAPRISALKRLACAEETPSDK